MKLVPWIVILAFICLYVAMHFSTANGDAPVADTVYTHDTVWEHFDTTVKKPMVIKQVIHDSFPVVFDAHPDYDSLKMQYENLVRLHTDKNIYQDSFKLGDYGYLHVNDTVQHNKLGLRSYKADYKIPTVIDSVIITKQLPEKPALYYGGGFTANRAGLNFIQMGLLYKTSKNISGVYMGFTPGFKVSAGVQYYWRLTNKK